jgi:hypothetical protein
MRLNKADCGPPLVCAVLCRTLLCSEMEALLSSNSCVSNVLSAGDLYIFVTGASPVPGLTHSMQALRFGEAAKQTAASRGWDAPVFTKPAAPPAAAAAAKL